MSKRKKLDISNLISYYKDCYQADTRTLSITNFFTNKVENRFFFTGKDELLNGNLTKYPLPEEYAAEVNKNLALYKREKVLYCGAFFIVGRRHDALRKDSKVCAPIFLYPATILHEEDFDYVQVDFSKRIININFLNTIKKEEVEDLYESILNNVDPKFSDLGTIGNIRRVLEAKLEDFDAEELLLYPHLQNEKQLKRLLQPANLDKLNGFKVIPTISLGILRRSSSTQGIISELADMIKHPDYSLPLKYVFDKSIPAKSSISLSNGRVPAILSKAQKEIIDHANRYTCSLVIGPPGTGKSFTISALALDFVSKGKSVLISSKTDQAVDVIGKKIAQDFEMNGVGLRAGKSDYKKSLKNHLKDLLTNTRRRPSTDHINIDQLKEKISDLEEEINVLSSKFEKQVSNELRWGKYVSEYENNLTLFKKLKFRYIKWRNNLQAPHWELTSRFLKANYLRIKYTRQLVEMLFNKQVHHSLYNYRGMFRDFLKSLSARQSSRQDMLFEGIDLDQLLKTFPLWLVNMADIHDIFPMEKEVFDVAIIDEATQCDVASCLPIIQRAKRVVIVGDPKQLRHTSFLSRSVQGSLQQKNNLNQNEIDLSLDYRNTNILDVINDRIEDQNQISFLDEHFRSKPDIIKFSNQNFYNNSLRIMTSLPERDSQNHIQVVEAKGTRNKKGVNELEAKLLIEKIKEIIHTQKDMNKEMCQSIGVLSPFRDQIDYLGSRLNEDIELGDIEKHDISCGTAYSFQGEERDIMLISLSIDDDSHHSAVIHLNRPEVFNVSMTRARTLQILYTSFSKKFNSGNYLKKYLGQIGANMNIEKSIETVTAKDKFMSEVQESLSKKDISYWDGFSVAGLLVDLVIKVDSNFYGINLIGYPGMYVDALNVEEYKVLSRAGLQTFPLPYTYWQLERDRCFGELMSFVEISPNKS